MDATKTKCLPDGSSVKREFQALFCEKPEVQSLRLTLPICARLHHNGDLCQSCQFATHRFGPPQSLRLIGTGSLGRLYEAALSAQGFDVTTLDADEASRLGLIKAATNIWGTAV